MPAIVWAKSSKIGYLSRAWPAPTCCIYSLLSNYLVLKTLYVCCRTWDTITAFIGICRFL